MQCFESSIGIENGMFIGHIAEIIASIGEPALPPLMQIANGSGTNFQRGLVLMTIGTIGREAGSSSKIQIRDLLLKVFRDKSERCRYEALEALTQMRCCPEIVVPEISRELNSESNLTKAQMLIALERYGRQARPAAAEMIRLLHDKDPLVRQVTTNTLRTIAPDLLRGAATKN
jgi:HEAT repeat protein